MKKNNYILLLLSFFSLSTFSQSLVINEIITSNSAVNTDDDGSYEDWVELYNGSTESINLEGYGLSDNANPFKWVFPAKTISPGEYLVIWCSEKDRIALNAPLHSNFKISASGETIMLTASNSITIDSYPPVVIPQNYTYGRQTDGSLDFVIFPEPTPGEANTTPGFTEVLESPVFSVASGFYSSSFELSLSGTDGTTILYTLDGSEPDENNLLGTTYQYKNQYPENPGNAFGLILEQTFISNQYTGPITIADRSSLPNKISAISSTYQASPQYIPTSPVPKSTVIRAKAIKSGAMPSAVVTKNYFIFSGETSSLPVLAINVDENKLFDYTDGIYVAGEDFDNWRTGSPNGINTLGDANYKRDGAEIKAGFSYYDQGQEVVNQEVGLRIHGGFTRSLPNKSLRIYGRAQYGNANVNYPFFGNSNSDNFQTLVLRNSGYVCIVTRIS